MFWDDVAIIAVSQRGCQTHLSGGDGMDCGHESFHDTKFVMDDLGQGVKQLVIQEALLMILRELS
jgi:hypothetical protein